MTSSTVLLVDNIPDHAARYAEALRADGFCVEVADAGTTGLLLARLIVPDCTVIDVRLPDMSGWDLCRELKQGPATRHVPVVVLTPDTSRAHAADSVRVRCNAWVAQPTIALDLVRIVRHVLASNGDAPASAEEAVLGVTQCPVCESDQVRATLRVNLLQYYSCRSCGHGWRVESV